jgi:hypothetical protein
MKRLVLVVNVLALVAVASTALAKGPIRVITTGNRLEGTPFTSLAGPAGPAGPLGVLGPSARSADPWFRHLAAFHPATYISGGRAWNRYASFLRRLGGPTSDAGILGRPIDMRQVPPDFRPGGRYALVGLSGILGVNGLRGVAGDTGAHGNRADAGGNYRNHLGKIVRSFTVGNRRTSAHELYELYDEPTARKLGLAGLNDTSFAAAGLLRRGESDAYRFTSRSHQHVVVAVVPEKFGENYDLVVRNAKTDEILARSNSFAQVNHVQLEVPRGTQLRAEVTLGYSLHPFANSYKLLVVGEKD